MTIDNSTPANPATVLRPTRRLLSVDALRGLTIAFMIMVNNNGDSRYAWSFMKHADWNGMTATDLVFPTFLFLAGLSVVLAFEARLARGATRAQLAWQTLRRTAILFAFGLVVNGSPYFHLSTLRIYGVLQRIAVCYLLASLLYLSTGKPAKRIGLLVSTLALALIGYWILMRFTPVPGLGIPGRDIPFLDKDANLVAWLDRHLLPGRLYEGTRDPEGLLSDLPALGTAILGVLTGLWLRTNRTLQQKASGLAAAAATCLILGFTWSLSFPLNKKLWTSSYVLAAAGIALALLALLYWIIEVRKPKGANAEHPSFWLWPWLVLGSNAIFAYIVSELLPSLMELIQIPDNGHRTNPLGWCYTHLFLHIPDQALASFAYSFAYMALCFLPTWLLYRKKIFLKV